MASGNPSILKWVAEAEKLCRPDSVFWCDGSDSQKNLLIKKAVESGDLEPLSSSLYPRSYLHRSDPNDVARTEHLTFICTKKQEDAGPTNRWMDPAESYQKLGAIFRGAMKGRTLYVIPFLMGPPGSPYSRVGVQVTDSVYVVLNMIIMTRVGKTALEHLGGSGDFTRCLHSKADLNIDRRFICHFPEDNTIWSIGSDYGGNAVLGKKCLGLRLASWMGNREGWMAEHMMIIGVENPKGKIHYIAGAFPSACGKTNLAMMIPALPGYKIWTVGDDIAWMHPGKDGRLWAINPEAGFFGVAPGTSEKTNPTAMKMIRNDTIFTNVVKTPDGGVWWEGMGPPPREGIDWQGKKWTPESGQKGAHPNSRFTAAAEKCPSLSPEWSNPRGVPISAILFGTRRASVAPLVYEAFDWEHGTFLGASMASETTAAATGPTGILRRDPMAMLPFCGYHMGDYFSHWLDMGKKLKHPPKIFHVNWFRKNREGEFLWPGYGQNIRVVDWVLRRSEGEAAAVESPLGLVPRKDAIDISGIRVSVDDLFHIDRDGWWDEAAAIQKFFDTFRPRLPAALETQLTRLRSRLSKP